jgi:hypothetical protein
LILVYAILSWFRLFRNATGLLSAAQAKLAQEIRGVYGARPNKLKVNA